MEPAPKELPMGIRSFAVPSGTILQGGADAVRAVKGDAQVGIYFLQGIF